jgi:hypothetical protein
MLVELCNVTAEMYTVPWNVTFRCDRLPTTNLEYTSWRVDVRNKLKHGLNLQCMSFSVYVPEPWSICRPKCYFQGSTRDATLISSGGGLVHAVGCSKYATTK